MEKNVYEAPESDLKNFDAVAVDSSTSVEDQNLKGLGGWLILVGLGVVISPIRMLAQVVPIYQPIFADGTFGLLTDPNSEYYTPYLGLYIITEILFNAAFILGSVYLIYLFFAKHYLFPKIYILLLAGSAMFILADAWVGSFFFPGEPMMDEETGAEFGRVMIGALIWIPYMLVSKRVKLTFVEHRPL